MKILMCESSSEPVNARTICLSNMKKYLEKNYNCSFEMKKVGENIIYVHKEKEDFISIRTVYKYPNMEEWIKDTTKIIDDFCENYEDGFIVMHLGIGDINKANYYNYPSIRALMTSQIRADHVIIYTTYKISKKTFYDETCHDYKLIITKDLEALFDTIQKICSKRNIL